MLDVGSGLHEGVKGEGGMDRLEVNDAALPNPLGLRISSSSSSSDKDSELEFHGSYILGIFLWASLRADGRFLRPENMEDTRLMIPPAVDEAERLRAMFSTGVIFATGAD